MLQSRSETIDLGDSALAVDISDALSEKDKVKFTVHTKVCCCCQLLPLFLNYVVSQTSLPEFQKAEFSVVRQHEEFLWLHTVLEDNEEYSGFIVS